MQRARIGNVVGWVVVLFLVARFQGLAQETVMWAPKPAQLPSYAASQRPHVRLADVKARHKGLSDWRERVVDDGHLQAEYISSPSGLTTPKRLHPDTRTWWVVLEGQMRVEIEGMPSFTAARGSLVQVPKQTMYSMETIGDQPSLRFAVNVASAKALYPQDLKPPATPGTNWVSVTLNRKPAGYENGAQPHLNLHDAAKLTADFRGGPFVLDDKVSAGIIYGYEKDLPPLRPGDRGHFHGDTPEFWLVMAGQIRFAIEGHDVFIGDEGDVAYVPPGTYHLARFYGAGPSCRLAITRFVGAASLIER